MDELTIKLTSIRPSIHLLPLIRCRMCGAVMTCFQDHLTNIWPVCNFRIDFSLTLWNCRTLDLRFHSLLPFRKRLRSEAMLICYSGFIEIVSRSWRYIKAKVPYRCCSGTFDRIRIGESRVTRTRNLVVHTETQKVEYVITLSSDLLLTLLSSSSTMSLTFKTNWWNDICRDISCDTVSSRTDTEWTLMWECQLSKSHRKER